MIICKNSALVGLDLLTTHAERTASSFCWRWRREIRHWRMETDGENEELVLWPFKGARALLL
jgi:hypothetical protein